MKPITPNRYYCSGGSGYLVLPYGERARVSLADYERHALGLYRWYRGARGAVVASIGADRRTVYLARLLSGAGAGDRVSLVNRRAFDAGDGRGDALDYRPENFRRVST